MKYYGEHTNSTFQNILDALERFDNSLESRIVNTIAERMVFTRNDFQPAGEQIYTSAMKSFIELVAYLGQQVQEGKLNLSESHLQKLTGVYLSLLQIGKGINVPQPIIEAFRSIPGMRAVESKFYVQLINMTAFRLLSQNDHRYYLYNRAQQSDIDTFIEQLKTLVDLHKTNPLNQEQQQTLIEVYAKFLSAGEVSPLTTPMVDQLKLILGNKVMDLQKTFVYVIDNIQSLMRNYHADVPLWFGVYDIPTEQLDKQLPELLRLMQDGVPMSGDLQQKLTAAFLDILAIPQRENSPARVNIIDSAKIFLELVAEKSPNPPTFSIHLRI